MTHAPKPQDFAASLVQARTVRPVTQDVPTSAAIEAVGPISFTVLAKEGGALTKRIYPSADGMTFEKDGSMCRMSRGTARRETCKDLAHVASVLSRLASNEAIALGVFADDVTSAEIVSKANARQGERTRTKGGPEGFVFHHGRPSLLLLDIDLDGHVEGYDGTVERAWALLTQHMPWLTGVGYIGRPSTSSGILRDGQRLDDPKKAGLHFYLVAENGADVPDLLKRIDQELWLKGLGFIKISKSGQRLFRTPVDASVGSPERLVFEAPPILEGGLTQEERTFLHCDGRSLALADIPPLSVLETMRLQELRKAAFGAAQGKAEARRVQWEADRQREAKRHHLEAGKSEAEATARAKWDLAAWKRSVLLGGVRLMLDHETGSEDGERELTVDALYEDAAAYDGCYCRDPDEPEKGPQKACLRLDPQGWLHLHSWLHGGRNFLLRPSLEGVMARIERWGQLDPSQQDALLRDCGRVDADEVGLGRLVDALDQRGLRRGDVKRVMSQMAKHGKGLLEALGEEEADWAAAARRPIDAQATHSEIAQDARLALAVSGVMPVEDLDGLYSYSDGIWEVIPEARLRTWLGMAYRHCHVVRRQGDVKSVHRALRDAAARPGFFDDTRPGVAIGQSFWSVAAGGQLASEPLGPEHGARFRLPFEPDFSGEPEMLGSLLTMVFKPEDRDDLASSVGALMGCAILGLGAQFKEAGFLIGAGDTGKSTIGALLAHFLPKPAVAAVPLGKMVHEYAFAPLAGARLNLPGEEAADVVIPAAALKQITGGDPLMARRPYEQSFSFVSQALQLFTANRMPPLREHELPVYRRIVFVPFSREVPEERRIGKTEIAAKKMFEAEGPRILGWAMICAAKAVAKGTMQTSATLAAAKSWRKADDSVLDAFLGGEACFQVTGRPENRVSALDAYRFYANHTQRAGRKPIGRNHFYERLQASKDLQDAGVAIIQDRKGKRQITGVKLADGEASVLEGAYSLLALRASRDKADDQVLDA